MLKMIYDDGFDVEQQYGITFYKDIDKTKEEYKERARKENNWIELYKKK